MLPDNVVVPDPVDTAAVAAWTAAVAKARADVARHTANAAAIAASLRLDVPGSPANLAHAALDPTLQALTAANTALAKALATQQQATNDAKTADAAVLTALAAEAAATKRVSDALGVRMAVATTSAALSATVDGLALRERYRAGGASPTATWDLATIPFRAAPTEQPLDPQVTLPVIGDADHTVLVRLLDDLDDSVDAIADIVAAEGVHQLAAGNLVRSGAALEIAASGTVPDELDVIRTPTPGYDLSHRVLLLGPAPTPAWTGTPSVAATADPAYAAWLTTLLPDPSRVTLTAVGLDAETGSVLATVNLTADELGLDAVDWLRVAADRGELAARVALAARPALEQHLGTPLTGPVRLAPSATIPTGGLPLESLLAACAATRALAGGLRALRASDLAAAGADPPQTTPEVEAAAVAAVHTAQQALTTLDDDLADAEQLSGDDLVRILLQASAVGLAEATPPLAAGTASDEALRALATATRQRLASRLGPIPFANSPEGTDATVDAARALLPTLLGCPVPLLLPVPLPADTRMRADLREGTSGLAAPPDVREWLLDHALVRPALGRLVDAYDTAEALGATGSLRIRATHVPRQADALWAGVDPAPAAGTVDLVVVRIGATTVSDQVIGLAVDSWTQTVPNATHDVAVAVHYDEPDADPPQAVLVAVPPSLAPNHQPGGWDLASLVGAVTSTMALAADRAVAAELAPGAIVTIASPQ
ncbi:hypothetical protein GCM10027517_21260 [Phycicoccus ginsengisoli]